MLRKIRIFTFVVCAALGLSACSSMNNGTQETAPATIDITNKEITKNPSGIESVSLPQNSAAPVTLSDYRAATMKTTGGAVEIYPLETQAIAPAHTTQAGGPAPVPPHGRGIAANQSVEIFSLDDHMNALFGGAPATAFQNASFPSAATAIIYYAHGSSVLSADDRALIVSLAAQARKGRGVKVEGHASVQSEIADPVTRKIANLKISMDRAFKVSAELIRQGVPGEKIETRVFGEERPPANIPPGKDKNSAARRVEIFGLPEQR